MTLHHILAGFRTYMVTKLDMPEWRFNYEDGLFPSLVSILYVVDFHSDSTSILWVPGPLNLSLYNCSYALLHLFGFEARNQFAAKLPQIILNWIRNQIGNCQVQVNNYRPFRQISQIPKTRYQNLRVVICLSLAEGKCHIFLGHLPYAGTGAPCLCGIS